MNKTKNLFIAAAIIPIMMFILGGRITSAQATSATILDVTPTPIITPVVTPDTPPGEIPSAEEQEELKTIVQSYIDTRYRALSISNAEDFKQNGFDSQMSEPSEMT